MSTDWAAHNLAVQDFHGTNLSSANRIKHVLMTAINAGDLRPGLRLKEIELGQQLGVSRTPLREAIAGLKAEGILSITDDGKLRVRVLGYQDVHALYQMRAHLEGLAAELTATQASSAERFFISEIRNEEANLIVQDTEPKILAELNGKFHQSILLASHNLFLIEAMKRLGTMMVLLGPTAYNLAIRVKEIGVEHDAINNAIQMRNPEAAANAAKLHLENAVKARLKIILAQDKASNFD
jgi:DNA-binding GntR family transcriptional regulator